MAPEPTLAQAPSPSAGCQRAPFSAGQRSAYSGSSPVTSVSLIGERQCRFDVDCFEDRDVPGQTFLIEESGGRRHRDRDRYVAQEAPVEKFAKGYPAGGAFERVRTFTLQPEELGGRVTGVDRRAGPLVVGIGIDPGRQHGTVFGRADVGPHQHRRYWQSRVVDSHDAVPEGGRRHASDLDFLVECGEETVDQAFHGPGQRLRIERAEP